MLQRTLLSLSLILLSSALKADEPYNPYASVVMQPGSSGSVWGATQVMYVQSLAAHNYALAATQKEKAKQEAVKTQIQKLEAKKKEIEHIKWELENKPYRADFEKRAQEESYRMQMIAASKGDIFSGYALEVLRKRMEPQSSLLTSDITPLPEQLLNGGLSKRINFTDGTYNASTGLLLMEKVRWQGLLQDDIYKKDREKVEELLKKGLSLAERGEMTLPIQTELKGLLFSLDSRIFDNVQVLKEKGAFDPYLFTAAKGQLRQIQESINFLSRPNPTETIFMKKSIDARTVGELIILMRDRGWKFDKALVGNEQAYTTLYNAMKKAISEGKFQ